MRRSSPPSTTPVCPATSSVFRGQYFRKPFLLSADDVLTEWTDEDQAAADPEPDSHCKGIDPKTGLPRVCFRCDPGNVGYQTHNP